MVMAAHCLQCGKVLFETRSGAEEVEYLSADVRKAHLEWEDGEKFFGCPYCSTKNVVKDIQTTYGPPQFRIHHVKI